MTETATELPVLNVDLLAHLLDWAEKSDKDWGQGEVQVNGYEVAGQALKLVWRQDVWNCGTSCCIAGAAVLTVGAVGEANGWVRFPNGLPEGLDVGGHAYDPVDDAWFVESVAQQILGLTMGEAKWLFGGENGVGSLRRLAAQFAQDRRLPQAVVNKLAGV